MTSMHPIPVGKPKVRTSVERGDAITNLTLKSQTWGVFIPIHWGNIRLAGYQVWSSGFYNLIIKTMNDYPFMLTSWTSDNSYYEFEPARTYTTQYLQPAIDIAYSFGMNGDPSYSRRLSKLFMDDMEVYNADDPDSAYYSFEILNGRNREVSEIIKSYLEEKTTYYPDQLYTVIERLTYQSETGIPDQVTAEFNTTQHDTTPLGSVYTGILAVEPSSVFMPDFDNNIMYIYRDELPYGRIEKYDLDTSEIISSNKIVITGPEGMMQGNTIKANLWFPKNRLILYQVINRGPSGYDSEYKNLKLWAINPDTGESVGSFGTNVEGGLPGDDLNDQGLPPCQGAHTLLDESVRAIGCFYRPVNAKTYIVEVTGSGTTSVSINVTKKEDLPLNAYPSDTAEGYQGTTYYAYYYLSEDRLDIYKQTLAGSTLWKQLSGSVEELPTRLICYQSKLLALNEDRATMYREDGNSVVYDKDFTDNPLTDISDANNTSMFGYYNNGSIGWSIGVSYLGILDIKDGTFKINEYDVPGYGRAWDSVKGRFWSWNRSGDNRVRYFQSNAPIVGGKIKLRDFMRSLYVFTGVYEPDYFEFQDIEDEIHGAVLFEPRTVIDVIAEVMALYRINKLETVNKIIFYRNQLATGSITISETVNLQDLALASENDDPIYCLKIIQTSDQSIRSQIDLTFLDIDANYVPNTVSYRRPDALSNSTDAFQINVPIVMSKNEALKLIQTVSADLEAAESKFEFRLPQSYLNITKGDIIRVKDREFDNLVKIVETNINGDFSNSFIGEGVVAQELVDIQVPDLPAPTVTNAFGSGKTFAHIFDVPALLPEQNPDDDNEFIQYSVIYGEKDKWQTGYLTRFQNDLFRFIYGTNIGLPILAYQTNNALTSKRWVVDNDDLNVTLLFGKWDETRNRTVTQLFEDKSKNVAFYGAAGRWEVVRFCSIQDGKVKGILRGTRGTDTVVGSHHVNDYFIPIVGSVLTEIRDAELIGTFERYKAVTATQSVDNSKEFSNKIEAASLKPWTPVNIKVIRESNDDLTITWTRRDRKNSSWGQPELVNSEGSLKFDLEIYLDVEIVRTAAELIEASYTYVAADQISDGLELDAETITLQIFQLSEVVGRGFGRKGTFNVE